MLLIGYYRGFRITFSLVVKGARVSVKIIYSLGIILDKIYFTISYAQSSSVSFDSDSFIGID
jgi:hypothetical protein